MSGRLLAWNAIGCLAGSLLGGIALYSVFDIARIYLLAPLIAAAGALIAAGPLTRFHRLIAGLLCLLSVVALAVRPGYRSEWLADGVFRIRTPQPASYAGATAFNAEFLEGVDILAMSDDALCRVTVTESKQVLYAVNLSDGSRTPVSETKGRALLVNGKSDSNTAGDITTLRMSTHLAALFSGHRERGLVIGLGTGVSAGELTLYPEIRRIDVAEISPTVADALPIFGAYTHHIHDDPRLKIELGDAILLLRRSRNKWDFITSEPSNLWVAGVEQLFTREFYRQVDEHLAPDGVFVQWVHLYESNLELVGTVVNTLHRQFPHLAAFRGSHNDLLLVASRHPFDDTAWGNVAETLRKNDRVRDSLSGVDAGSAEALQRLRLEGFDGFVAGAEKYGVQTMDRPRLQTLANHAFFDGSMVSEDAIAAPPR